MKKNMLIVGTLACVGVAIALRLAYSAAEPTPAPEFPKGATWLQKEPLAMASLRGQVIVLHFWTFGCINCRHNYPVYKGWQEQYTGKDVKLIGVHTPELDDETNVASVQREAGKNGLKYPIVIDNDHRIWKSWGNQYWPSIYLVDKKGRVRYHWDGELHLDASEGRQFASHIDELLAEKD